MKTTCDKNETLNKKNKVFKLYGAKEYLTQKKNTGKKKKNG
jgi:hypothetical protein